MEKVYKEIFKIWGRDISIDIVYDCFDEENITNIQQETYNQFIQMKTQIFE